MRHWVHLGTQKAGSSFLRGLLAQVPEVGLADKQELDFFGFEPDQSYAAYLERFPDKRPVLFENSPIYFRQGAKCAPPLATTLADKQPMLSLLLRDPVEAIISHHDMQLRQNFFSGPHDYTGDPSDLAAFVRQNPHYLDRCRYMDLLERHWLPRFPLPSFAIRTFEEFTARPAETLRELAALAGLDAIGEVEAGKVAKNARPASAFAHRILMATGRSPALAALRRRAMAVPGLRKLAERALFDKSRQGSGDGGRLAEVRAELAESFRSDVARLCEFLGRDSLPWRNFFEPANAAAAGPAAPVGVCPSLARG